MFEWIRGDRHGGRPYVLLHGFLGGVSSWNTTAAAIPKARPIAALYLPGHDASAPLVAGASFRQVVARIAAFLQEEAGCDLHLVGYSLGGRIALALALWFPELAASLSLIGAHPGLSSATERGERAASDARWAQLLREAGMATFIQAWEAQPLFASQNHATRSALEAQRRGRLGLDPRAMAQVLLQTSLSVMPAFWSELPTLGIPVRWITGSLDEKFQELARRAQALTPRGSLVTIPACGHNPLLEQPTELARHLEQSG